VCPIDYREIELCGRKEELMAGDQKNRRRTARRKPKTTAKVELRRGTLGLGANLAQRLLDISEVGVGIIVKVPLKVGEEVEIVISDHGQSKPFKQVAKVCRCQALDDGTHAVGLIFDKSIPYADIYQLAKP
jgi:hypothetical protein